MYRCAMIDNGALPQTPLGTLSPDPIMCKNGHQLLQSMPVGSKVEIIHYFHHNGILKG